MVQILESYPDSASQQDIAAFEYLYKQSTAKERVGVVPEFTFDQFTNGVATHIPGMIPIVDAVGSVESPPDSGNLFIPNFKNSFTVETTRGNEFKLPSMLSAFDDVFETLEEERKKSLIVMLAPHPSMATPYLIARALIEKYGANFAPKINIVIGPRPASFSYQISDMTVSPVGLGRALSTLHLTGPNTESTRNAPPEVQEWIKERARTFKDNISDIAEPASDGDNDIIIWCASGRTAEKTPVGTTKEFRSDNLEFLASLGHVGILPIGVYDNLLGDNSTPGSPVYMRPDTIVWRSNNVRNIQHLHNRSVLLSESPFGALAMESISEHLRRLTKKKVAGAAKRAVTAFSPALEPRDS